MSVNSHKRDEGFEPKITEVAFAKYRKDAQEYASSPLLTNLAGRESRAGNPLVRDFILLGQKLAKLGFIYHRGNVLIIEPEAAELERVSHA